MSGEWVTLAVLGVPRGNRGELLAVSLSDAPGRFEKLERVVLFQGEQKLGEYRVESAWWHEERLVLKFAGIDSIDAAGMLAHCEVRIPAVERVPLAAGEFYQSDLLGFDLVDAATGEKLGQVTGWEDYSGKTLMEIDNDWLVPYHKAICRNVDRQARSISVVLPEGLKELNRS